jgi:hypothetical protein
MRRCHQQTAERPADTLPLGSFEASIVAACAVLEEVGEEFRRQAA